MSKIYDWEQEFGEVVIKIKLNNHTEKKDIKITTEKNILKISIKGEIIIENEFTKKVNCKDVVWYIDAGFLIIQAQKEKNERWDSCFIGGDTVNVEEIASNRAVGLDGLDPEARAMVEKMMYEQRSKELGIETEEDKMKRELIERINNQENESNFK